MKNHDREFCSRPSTTVLMKFSYNRSEIAFLNYGEHWRQMRRLGTLEIFSMKRVQSLGVEIEEHSLSLTNDREHEDQEEDFLDVLLKSQKDSPILNMFLGGTDTSAAVLEWAMTELVKCQSMMKKALDEARKVVGNTGKVEESDLTNKS
ncbi:putative cytochrome P450 [Dioscorea sansibarensis]